MVIFFSTQISAHSVISERRHSSFSLIIGILLGGGRLELLVLALNPCGAIFGGERLEVLVSLLGLWRPKLSLNLLVIASSRRAHDRHLHDSHPTSQ